MNQLYIKTGFLIVAGYKEIIYGGYLREKNERDVKYTVK